jgi:hypothetical protein
MDFRPPTDNLYKFIAIAGLLILGFSVYLRHTVQVETQRLEMEFYKSDVERFTTGSIGGEFPPPLTGPSESISFPDGRERVRGSDSDRQSWDTAINALLNEQEKHTGMPAKVSPNDYFQRPDVVAYYRDIRGLSDTEIQSMAAATNAETLWQLGLKTRDAYRAAYRDNATNAAGIVALRRQVDYEKSIKYWTTTGMTLGCFLAGIGFVLWLYWVQIPEDRRLADAAKS